MAELIQASNEKGFRSRSDRRLTQGVVVDIDTTAHVLTLDVGVVDANGDPVLMENVPYQPHTPPQIRDTVTFYYGNVSPHSISMAGSQVGGTNSGQTVQLNLGIQSANVVLSGPASGGAAAPTWRSLVAADLPIGTVSGTVAAGDDSRFTTIQGNNQTGTTYTLVLTDAGKVVEGNNAGAIALTIPPHSSVAFPVGTTIYVWQQGAGQVTITAGAGVTLRSPGGLVKTATQYATVLLRQRATDEWVLSEDVG